MDAATRPAATDLHAQKTLSHRDARLIILGMMLPVFMGSLDSTILATALPAIGRDLGHVSDLPWLITTYLIAATASTPLYGKISDIRGRRFTTMIALERLYGRIADLRARAQHGGAHPRPGDPRPRRRRPDLDRHGGARRRRRAERTRPLLCVLLDRLHDGGRLRTGAGRLSRRPSALDRDLLVQHSARSHGVRFHHVGAAPVAAL